MDSRESWHGINPAYSSIQTHVDPVNGLIPIETQDSIPTAQPASAGSTANKDDLAGVLRRNQACIQCRRRKLKCDAARPTCATCVRSHKHLLRTNPRSDAVLTCEYDDQKEDGGTHSPASREGEGERAAKKRKAQPGEARKRKESEEEKLKRKIRE